MHSMMPAYAAVLATIAWPPLVLAAIVALLLITWPAYSRLITRAMTVPQSRAEFDEAIRALEALRRSWLPPALYTRLLKPGAYEMLLASRCVGADRNVQALHWAEEGLRVARSVRIRALLHQTAAMATVTDEDSAAFDRHARAFAALATKSSAPQLRAGVVQARVLRELCLGRLREAWDRIREATADAVGDQRSDSFLAVCSTLVAMGRSAEVFRLTQPMLVHREPGARRSDPNAPLSAPRGSHAAALVHAQHAHESACLACALDAARHAERWDLFVAYLDRLDAIRSGLAHVAIRQLGYRAILHAHLGETDQVADYVDEMRQRVPGGGVGPGLAHGAADLAATAWQIAGQHERALAEIDACTSPPPTCLDRSCLLATRANSLEALGRSAEAAPLREEARRLAPCAYWNHPPPDILPTDAEIEEVVTRYEAAPDFADRDHAGAAVGSGPVPPVASWISYVICGLAIAAFVPFVGIVPTIALLVFTIIALASRNRPRHDRPVAKAGLIVAVVAAAAWYASAHASVRRIMARAEPTPPAATALTTTRTAAIDPAVVVALQKRLAEVVSIDDPDERAHALSAFFDDLDVDDVDLYERAWDTLDDREQTRLDEASEILDRMEDESEAHAAAEEHEASKGGIGWYMGAIMLGVLVVSVMLHEIGHAVAAYWQGDPTARDDGRLSVNPLRHIDPFGSVILPIILMLLPGGTAFGWAKPVPYRKDRLRNERAGQFFVSIAGVSWNLFLALAATSAIVLVGAFLRWRFAQSYVAGILMPVHPTLVFNVPAAAAWGFVFDVLKITIVLNLVLLGLNLLPIPPLDGFGVLRSILPASWAPYANKLQGIGIIVVLVVLATGSLTTLLRPAIYAAAVLLVHAQMLIL